MSLKDRLELYSIPIPESGCQIWIGACFSQGYGVLQYKGKNLKAHRVSYQEHVGLIPDGKHVCHHCDIKSCINPKHLFIGSHQDNMRDREKKNLGGNSKKTHCKNGHEFIEENIIYEKGITKLKRRCWTCHRNRQRNNDKRPRKTNVRWNIDKKKKLYIVKPKKYINES